MSTSITKQNASAVSAQPDRVEVALSAMVDKFQAVLPAELPAERFCRVAINAMQDARIQEVAQTPEGRASIYTEVLVAATDGLLLDKREAFLNVYSVKGKDANGREVWQKLAKYMPMYQGLAKLARNSGVIADIKCDVVKIGDEFSVDKMAPAGACPLTHRYPEDAFARGAPRGVYAVALLRDGTWSNAEVMSVADVEKVRSISPSKDKSAWSNHWAEMARKTVIRRLTKYLPKSTDGLDRLHNAATRGDDYAAIEATTNATSLPAPERKRPMAAALLAPPAKPQQAEPEPSTVEHQELQKSPPPKRAAKKPPPPKDDDEGFDDRGGYDEGDEDEDGDV